MRCWYGRHQAVFGIAQAGIHLLNQTQMDLQRACDELKNIIGTAEMIAVAWEKDPDNYAVLEDHLNDLVSEFKRIGEAK